MLKRRLFDSIQDFHGINFIDLCAGTGSIGLEALSRGAQTVTCVDHSSMALKLLKENKKKISQFVDSKKLNIIKSDATKWLELNFVQDHHSDTYIFYDPPYQDISGYEKIYQLMVDKNYQAKLIFEGCTQKTMPLKDFEKRFPAGVKTFKQGTSFFIIYDFK
jgi:16S rRNA (guanine966-N2)-methyltransferase